MLETLLHLSEAVSSEAKTETTEVKSTVKYYRWFVLYLLLNLGFHSDS
jgi:hypothetical protein